MATLMVGVPLFAGKYELGELLHRGAHYDVFAARREADGADLVLKYRHPSRDLVEEGLVNAEAVVYALAKSPAMIPVRDFGDVDGRPFVVMDRVIGALTLAESVAAVGPFAPRRALPILYQLVRAIDDVHRASIAHGDIRMENVLLAPNGERPPHVLLAGFFGALHPGSPKTDGVPRSAMRADLAALGPILSAMIAPSARPASYERIIEGIRDYFDARAVLEHLTRSLLLDAPLE